VPAAMTLLGDANWWMPRWMDRLLPAVGIDGRAGSPMPENIKNALQSANASVDGLSGRSRN